MDPDQQETAHRRNHTTQSIPLQDLARPPEDESVPLGPVHRRTLSERAGNLFQSTPSRGYPQQPHGRYSALRDTGQSGSVRQVPLDDYDDDDEAQQRLEHVGPYSHSRIGALQGPVGGFGYVGDDGGIFSSIGSNPLPIRADRLGNLTGANDSFTSIDDFTYDNGSRDSPPVDASAEETVPLTDPRSVQPMGGMEHRTPTARRHNRLSTTPTVRFSIIDQPPSPSRLGDDLHTPENAEGQANGGLGRSPSKLRSLSPSSAGSPFRRASTVVRNLSQRVVNISNEPEIAEQSMRRRQSKKGVQRPERREASDTRYTHDGTSSPSEQPDFMANAGPHDNGKAYRNPLKGRSLGIFPPDSPLRTRLCDLLVHEWTEPAILALIVFQVVLIAIDIDSPPREWGSWIDFALLALFSIYTAEIVTRTIVSGFIINPLEYSTINRGMGLKAALLAWAKQLFALQTEESASAVDVPATHEHNPLRRAFTGNLANPTFNGGNRQQARVRLAHRAYLRHSFNRVDFIAVLAYWINFVLYISKVDANNHFYLFQMMSSLRILRLLGLTTGTSIILRSLKKAAPLLLNVALLIGFFWLLFAIVGVQAFKSSLSRECVWTGVDDQSDYRNPFQFCGGSLDANGTRLPWYYADGTTDGRHKGFLCPPGSRCISGTNPYSGTVSFDNIAQSVELVFVLMTGNTYSDIMYYLTNSDYLAAALFFAAGTIVMSFWLVNLLIAVITTSFQVIREQSKTSAFANKPSDEPLPEVDEEKQPRTSNLLRSYERTIVFWNLTIAFGLICQCLRTSEMSAARASLISVVETIVTLALLVEIVFRFAADARNFFRKIRNWFDLMLVVITCVIQLPFIHDSGQPYAWLTIFQILRVYRLVLALPFTRNLILLVVGNVSGLLNLIIFVFLLTFFAALLAAQLFQGLLPAEDEYQNKIYVRFTSVWNSFLGMYQIFSSENWTTILYYITQYSVPWQTAWIGAVFIILWFILAFFIVLNMFIAVIQENFDVSEDEKRVQQVRAFLQRKEVGSSSSATLSLSALFKLRELGGRRQDPLDYGQAMIDQLLKPTVAQEFLEEHHSQVPVQPPTPAPIHKKRPTSVIVYTGLFGFLRTRMAAYLKPSDPNPFYSRLKFTRSEEDIDPRSMAQEVMSAAEQRKKAQREYLIKHPQYNVSLYIFRQDNPIRRICQKIVGPGRGSERIEGTAPSPIIFYTFSALIYLIIVGMVVLACITTPLYQRQYLQHQFMQGDRFTITSWFVLTDLAFALIFTFEGAVRVIADGFFWTPHAYLRSSWGLIDGIVLVTLWINVASLLLYDGNVSRAVGAFKALRALRLLNVSDSARDTFHSVIVLGGWKVLSAAFVSLSLLFPFAIYGLNLFNGRLQQCNDNQSGIHHLSNCVDEYESSPFGWNVVAPRQAANQWFNFDNFGESMLILFSIVSQEGWVTVMWAANSITGVSTQPLANAAPGNGVFFVIFNLLGAVFVLTLFISVFMRNYTEQTGVAFLTAEQRSWLELRKLLRQISPSKRRLSTEGRLPLSSWCYKLAKKKTGRWQRFVTAVLVLHLALLCVDFYPAPVAWSYIRTYIFLLLTVFYLVNIAIRIIGLSWTRFRRNSWDMYALGSVSGTFIATILFLTWRDTDDSLEAYAIYSQFHNFFLVSIVLLLIPRNNQLDQLFKTAAASLTSIANLLATWAVLFLVYAIAFTQAFSLTRFGQNENGNINFRNVPKALILLYRMSTGEGWNQLMQDFARVNPPLCTPSENFLESDCGSTAWALALFISWNIVSMYIFVNLFISLIFESFSYVYQRSSGLTTIKRGDIRKFKQAWSEYDPAGTGYITKEQFPRFMAELSGVFEMRIYEEQFSIRRLIDDCKVDHRHSALPIEGASLEIDIHKLNARLSHIPVSLIRQRKKRLDVFYEEVLHSADQGRGIGFTSLLMTLAHYKIITDNKSLRLEEFLRRRARLQRVEDDVKRAVVANFLDVIAQSRRFREHKRKKQSGRMTAVPQLQVPEIFIEDEDSPISPLARGGLSPNRPALSLQIPSEHGSPGGSSRSDSPHSATGSTSAHLRTTSDASPRWQSQLEPGQVSPTRRSFDSNGSPGRTSRAGSRDGGPSPIDETFMTPEGRRRDRAGSSVSAISVLDAFDQSAWGESIRRSMTTRRGTVKGRGGGGGGSGSGGGSGDAGGDGDGGEGGHSRDPSGHSMV